MLGLKLVSQRKPEVKSQRFEPVIVFPQVMVDLLVQERLVFRNDCEREMGALGKQHGNDSDDA